jgi:CheY-like chemotaxis protein
MSESQMCCRPRILCVDDNEYNLLALTTILSANFNIYPDEAVNGQMAIDMFKEGLNKECKCSNRAYKLILMDI